jgi:tRNA (guanine-N7-)-methyltransferase
MGRNDTLGTRSLPFEIFDAMKNPPSQSRQVSSTQKEVHPGLLELLVRQHSREWSQPLHRPTVDAFEALQPVLAGMSHKIVLDSGCGSGESTMNLARVHTDCTVIGVDKSLDRLSRTGADSYPHTVENALWIRAELASFWRLARQSGWHLERHYMLYPNPWPKPGQLQRRWHAHPVFPDVLRLGGRLEMRCNWEPYALEFAASVNHLLEVHVEAGTPPAEPVLSPFERKYRKSGHRLYSVVVSADANRLK